jgi:hypothetical protein
MALTKEIGVKGEFTESGHVQVCTVTRVLEDGVVISSSNHRHVITPGDDYSSEHPVVQAVCASVKTKEVVDAYKAKIADVEIKQEKIG